MDVVVSKSLAQIVESGLGSWLLSAFVLTVLFFTICLGVLHEARVAIECLLVLIRHLKNETHALAKLLGQIINEVRRW